MVTGVAGLVGSHLVEKLLSLDYEVHGFEFPAKTNFSNNLKPLIGGQSTMSIYHWLNFSGLKHEQNVSVELIIFEIRPKRYLHTGA